jgi:5'/3'-nucleotidase
MTGHKSFVVTLGLIAVSLAVGAVPDAEAASLNKCTQSKIKAAGKNANKKATCGAKAVSKGSAVDPACSSKADGTLVKAFARAEKKQDCLAATGDAASIETRVDSFVDDLVCDLGGPCAQATTLSQPMRVLVTNDDGVAAPGIDALVTALASNSNLALTVIAPATNQSGTGDSTTSTTIAVTNAATASGFPAMAVNGFPADTALFGILQALSPPPDLVVSGINAGQNISAEIVPISGTVGAGLWAARKGVPAIAASQGLGGSISYSAAASYVAAAVERFRTDAGFRNKMRENRSPFHGVVLNMNFPTCSAGTMRGVRVVPLGRGSEIIGYTLVSDVGGTQTWQATVQSANIFATDCTSSLTVPTTDVEAMMNGFASITPLAVDLGASGRSIDDFQFLEE